MYNDQYGLMHNLLDKQDADFDYAHVLDRHIIFHYWEVPNCESDGDHGHWVSTKCNLFVGHIKPQFCRFPYIFDFKNPLLSKHELLSRRHSLSQDVIYGEQEAHSCEQYDLSVDINILGNKIWNTKLLLEDGAVDKNLLEAKSNLTGMAAKNFSLKLFHIDEICSALGTSVIDIANKPEHYGRGARRRGGEWRPGGAQRGGTRAPFKSETEAIILRAGNGGICGGGRGRRVGTRGEGGCVARGSRFGYGRIRCVGTSRTRGERGGGEMGFTWICAVVAERFAAV
jgi:hypothetical protein